MVKLSSLLANGARSLGSYFLGRDGGYDAGRYDRPETAGWTRRRQHAESTFRAASDTITGRTEDEDRNNAWINGALDRDWERVVGSGLQPWPTPIYRVLGKDVDWSLKWSQQYRDLYRLWAEDPLFRCDALMRESFGRLEAKARLNFRRGGEVLVEIRRDERGATCPVNILLIDPARLENPMGKGENDPNFRNGIEYSKGVPVAAWIRPRHPASTALGPDTNQPERVPFRSATGLPNLLLISYTRFIEQVRGISPMAPSLIVSKMLDSYEGDIANRAKLEAQMGAFIKSPGTPEDLAEALAPTGASDDNPLANYVDYRSNNPIKAIGNLFMRMLLPDEDVKFMPPVTPGDNYAELRRSHLSKVAASTGQSYPEISQDHAGINLSNMRAIENMRHRIVEIEREFWSQQFNQPINLAVMEHYVSTGDLKIPGGPVNFYRKMAAVTNTTWIGPDRGVVDAEKEARAHSLNAAAYRESPYEAIIARRREPSEIMDQAAAFYRELNERGLPPPDYNTKGQTTTSDGEDGSAAVGNPQDGDKDGVPNEAAKKKAKAKPTGGPDQ